MLTPVETRQNAHDDARQTVPECPSEATSDGPRQTVRTPLGSDF